MRQEYVSILYLCCLVQSSEGHFPVGRKAKEPFLEVVSATSSRRAHGKQWSGLSSLQEMLPVCSSPLTSIWPVNMPEFAAGAADRAAHHGAHHQAAVSLQVSFPGNHRLGIRPSLPASRHLAWGGDAAGRVRVTDRKRCVSPALSKSCNFLGGPVVRVRSSVWLFLNLSSD